MTPKLSVVLPVWNGEKYLRAALDSVFGQSFIDFELIVVDDGSTDGTAAILNSYSDPRLQVHRVPHEGIVKALNFGVSVSRADWIVRHDADDISLPERFASQWQAVQARSNTILSFCDVTLIGENAERASQPHLPRTKALLALRLCQANPVVHSTVLFRKDAFVRAGGYQLDERHAEDFALWGRMLELGEVVPLPTRLLQLRMHPESVSRTNLETQMGLTASIAKDHCRRFMRLTNEDAKRAFEVLSFAPHARSRADWLWFLRSCAPRLRWKSLESHAWLLSQTIRRIAGASLIATRGA